MKRLLFGLINGLIAGAVAGVLLNQHTGQQDPESALPRDLATAADRLARARTLFEQGRRRARAARAAAPASPAVHSASGSSAVRAVAPAHTAPLAVWRGQLRTRWQEAVAAGREASAEKEAELRRKYLEQTGRLGDEGNRR